MKPVWDEKEKRSNYKDILLDSGEYTAKISKAEWTTSEYMITDYNAKGACLSVWIDINYDGENKRIFDKISVTSPTKLNALREAVGLKPVKKGENFNEKPLNGKQVYVEVEQYTSKAGKVSNIIKQYLKDIVEDSVAVAEEEDTRHSFDYDNDSDLGVPF
jgi:hypothetical protein